MTTPTTDGLFTYHRDADGCDETWDVCYPDGSHLVSIHFWERADETEAEAKMIVDALNAHDRSCYWFRALNNAEFFLRPRARRPWASRTLRTLHRRLLDAIGGAGRG